MSELLDDSPPPAHVLPDAPVSCDSPVRTVKAVGSPMKSSPFDDFKLGGGKGMFDNDGLFPFMESELVRSFCEIYLFAKCC